MEASRPSRRTDFSWGAATPARGTAHALRPVGKKDLPMAYCGLILGPSNTITGRRTDGTVVHRPKETRSMRTRIICVTMTFAAACGSDARDMKATGTVFEPILGGASVTTDGIGTPWVSTSVGNCSGTLVRPNWLLTAHHCVTLGNWTTGGTAIPASSVTAGLNAGTVNAAGVQLYRHPSLDVALVQLSTAPQDGTGRVFYNPLYRGSTQGLASQNLYVQGWGDNTCTAGWGALRSATVPIGQVYGTSVPTTGFELYPNAAGQLPWEGDSGSGAFVQIGSLLRAAGVASSGLCMQYETYSGGDAFRDWANGIVGNSPAVGSPAGYERADANNAIVYQNPSNHIGELKIGPGGSWTWGDLTLAAAGAPSTAGAVSAYVRSDSVNAVVFRSPASHLVELSGSSGLGWTSTDLSQSTSAYTESDPAAYVRGDGTNAIVFIGFDGNVYEFSRLFDSTTWNLGSLSSVSGAPVAASADAGPVGYVRMDGSSAVVYRTSTNDIGEISLSPSGWVYGDLSQITGAPAAAGMPRPYTRCDGTSSVIYFDVNGHVQEIFLAAGSAGWAVNDLTSAAPGAVAAVDDPSPYVRSDNMNAVLYRSSDNHIHELSRACVGGTGWSDVDLSYITNAPAAMGVPGGYARNDRVNSVYFTSIMHKHVYEMSLPIGGSWSVADITSIAGGP